MPLLGRRRSDTTVAFSDADHIDALELARAALRTAEAVYCVIATDNANPFDRGRAAARSLLLDTLIDGVSYDCGAFYGARPLGGMHPLTLRLGDRGQALYDRCKALSGCQRMEEVCAALQSAHEQLTRLANGFGPDTAAGAVAAERARMVADLLNLAESERDRLTATTA